MTRLTPADANELAVEVLRRHRFTADDAEVIADHLVDAHLTGYTFAGLPRLLVVLERLQRTGETPGAVEVTHETPVSASVRGNGNVGYVVCRRAVDIAINKATNAGIAVVGASDSYYSGRSGYYTERAARAGFVALHASSAFPMVAPTGATNPVLGSNPLTFAFPAPDAPVVVDLSTAAITWGEIQLAQRTGAQLPPGVAIDADGRPTVDPSAALHGAALPWGGHKGYALGLAVQALALFAGGDAIPASFGNFGFLFILMRRDLLIPSDQYDQAIAELLAGIAAASTDPGGRGAQIPGQRGAQRRAQTLADGYIEVPDEVYRALRELLAAP